MERADNNPVPVEGVDREAALLDFVLSCAAENPAAIGSQRKAMELLQSLGIPDRDGFFFHAVEAGLEDARHRLAATPPEPSATAGAAMREALERIANCRIAGDVAFVGGPTIAQFARATLDALPAEQPPAAQGPHIAEEGCDCAGRNYAGGHQLTCALLAPAAQSAPDAPAIPAGMALGEGREYRKTATIRAVQWWKMGDHPAVMMASDVIGATPENPLPFCPTLEGGHVVTPGDWIATGVQGEHWPIKSDVFAATYAPVDALTIHRHADGPSFMQDRTWPECLDLNAAHNRRAALSTPPHRVEDAGLREAEIAHYRQALEDVCNPLGYLQRMAEAEGNQLNRMAHTIAADIATVQLIACRALGERV